MEMEPSRFDPCEIEDHGTFLYEKGSSGRVESTQVTPLEAFNRLHQPLYRFLESYREREVPAMRGGGMYSHHQISLDAKEPNPEERRELERFRSNLDKEDLWAETWVKDSDGKEYVFEWNLRKEADPESVGTPYSMVHLRSEEGYDMGFRILRLYEPDVLEKGIVRGKDSYDSDLTSQFRWRDRLPEDAHGWLQEPFLRASLDRQGGVHDALEGLDIQMPRLTTRNQAYVDERQNPGDTSYEQSKSEFGLFYQWSEPLFSIGLQRGDAERAGKHLGALNALGLMGYPDRDHEELLIETVPDGRYEVQQKDLEFMLYTDNPSRIDGNDVNDFRHVIEQGIRSRYRSKGTEESESEYEDVRELPDVATSARAELLRRARAIDDEDIIHLIPDNVPSSWDEDLFPREMTQVKEW
ncbi:MAG: hypothetical protein SVS85_01395 [Candidatus Nanohaloarchaea archaeon]|nr:hypothetical protein [Candidatus Nanohaloarchaea archaeon]